MRIASLLPSATEIVCALGLEADLVGVTHECDFPESVRRLPHLVTATFEPRGLSQRQIDRRVREAVRAGASTSVLDRSLLSRLAPDLVLTQGLCDVCAVPESDVLAAVSELHPRPRVLSLHPHSLEHVLRDIEETGEALGVPGCAREVVEALRARLGFVEDAVRGSVPCGVAALEWLDPVMTSGHWVGDQIRVAGGRDLLGRPGRPARTVDWSEVVAAAPEVLALMPCGFDAERTAEGLCLLEAHPGFGDLPAVRAGRVYALNGSAHFSRPGPRVVDGVEVLAEVLHPEATVRMGLGADYLRLGAAPPPA